MSSYNKFYYPGDIICDEEGLIRGHGTTVEDEKIISTYFGYVTQIDKLLTVYPSYSYKYSCDVGDVIIGRVKAIYNKKWILETGCKNDTSLSLGSVNLPGVIQRRKVDSDEMDMRNIFSIGDLVVTEVQKVSKYGNVSLHARSNKFGKLTKGHLLKVPAYKLESLESRFINNTDFSIIVGANGYIWMSGDVFKISVIREKILSKLKESDLVNINSIIENLE